MTTSILLVYVTCANERQAQRIGKTVVKERLAACAVVLAGSTRSFFFWKHTFQSTREAVLLLKTSAKRFPSLEKRIHALHSYDVPAILAWQARTSRAYKKWVDDSTSLP